MGNHILSCDWGTSSFRLRLVQPGTATVVAETTMGDGIAAVNALWQATKRPPAERLDYFRTVLQAAISSLEIKQLNGTPVYLSGMASSSIGMKMLDYGVLPFDLSLDTLPHDKISADNICRHDIYLFSGLRSDVDVMRGEETILSGCYNASYEECLVIFPGTHSKHAHTRGNLLIDFTTYMTGEFFDLLSNKSILAGSIAKCPVEANEKAFQQGVENSINGNLLHTAFLVRTNQLFAKMNPEENYQYLSGLVIGAELKEIAPSMKNILLISSTGLSESYLLALDILGFGGYVQNINADEALIRGHLKYAG